MTNWNWMRTSSFCRRSSISRSALSRSSWACSSASLLSRSCWSHCSRWTQARSSAAFHSFSRCSSRMRACCGRSMASLTNSISTLLQMINCSRPNTDRTVLLKLSCCNRDSVTSIRRISANFLPTSTVWLLRSPSSLYCSSAVADLDLRWPVCLVVADRLYEEGGYFCINLRVEILFFLIFSFLFLSPFLTTLVSVVKKNNWKKWLFHEY